MGSGSGLIQWKADRDEQAAAIGIGCPDTAAVPLNRVGSYRQAQSVPAAAPVP